MVMAASLMLALASSAHARQPAAVDVLEACSWDKPGVQPFMGDLVAAVDHYTDIPPATRKALKARMAKRQYEDIAVIRRNSVQGKASYGADLRDMHFAQGRVCKTVSRKAWGPSAVERGLVYCEGEHCLIVPTVCRNLSRVTRDKASADSGGREENESAAPRLADKQLSSAAAPAQDSNELQFDPPGAGRADVPAGEIPVLQPDSDNFGGNGNRSGLLAAPAAGSRVGAADSPTFVEASAAPAAASDLVSAGADSSGGNGTGPDSNTAGPGWPAYGSVLPPGTGLGSNAFGASAVIDTPTAAVPEPGTWLMLLSGAVVVVAMARRRRPVGAPC